MNKINRYKNILITLTITIILIITIFTIDVINETQNWSFLDIDFKNKNNIVSAYGTLVGGILAFLSILFVLYGLLEQRQQIITEKIEKQEEHKKELIDKLKLLSSYFNSAINEIISQGETFKDFSIKEKKSPSTMNTMYFGANKNFSRVIDIDPLSMYKAIRENFSDEVKWENIFLNILSIFDFYTDGLKDLQLKYQSQIKFKVKEQRKISHQLNILLNTSAKLVDKYKLDLPNDYMQNDWVKLLNEFTFQYYDYLNDCEENNEPSNLRSISDNILFPFLEKAMNLRQKFGYEYSISRKLVFQTSNIRKKINEIEQNCINYANDIEKQFNEYFSMDSTYLTKLKALKQKIDNRIME